jgi:hypothetical protein
VVVVVRGEHGLARQQLAEDGAHRLVGERRAKGRDDKRVRSANRRMAPTQQEAKNDRMPPTSFSLPPRLTQISTGLE